MPLITHPPREVTDSMRHRISRRLTIVGATIVLALAAPLGVVLAAHFNDVPDSHLFHDDIAALAASGVTTGCGGGNFCPDQFVTRGQMAAFLNRLGLTPVNARTGDFAYVWANNPSAASYTPNTLYSYSSSGGAITITRVGVGHYRVAFSGLSLNRGHVQVSKYGAGAGTCHVEEWFGGSVWVLCYNAAGAAADSTYTVMFVD